MGKKLSNGVLKYHYHPEKGWINDPNGLSFFNGYYHLFYQHCPNSEYPGVEPMVWGHARTKNFSEYEELPIAIQNDESYDINGVWSGTATEKDGILYAFYASVNSENRQQISLATSKDGITFEKYEKNPIISEYPLNCGDDFRDPAILCVDGTNYLVIASADRDKNTGTLLLYRSGNMFDWEYVGIMMEYDDCRYCECPSFIKYKDGFILSVSVCPNNGDHYFEVMYGSFNGETFAPKITSHFQKGPDEYAGQIFLAPDGRAILISWVPGWQYQPHEKCIGCLSIPLEITVCDNEIKAYPVAELRHLINDECVTDEYICERYENKGASVYIKLEVD